MADERRKQKNSETKALFGKVFAAVHWFSSIADKETTSVQAIGSVFIYHRQTIRPTTSFHSRSGSCNTTLAIRAAFTLRFVNSRERHWKNKKKKVKEREKKWAPKKVLESNLLGLPNGPPFPIYLENPIFLANASHLFPVREFIARRGRYVCIRFVCVFTCMCIHAQINWCSRSEEQSTTNNKNGNTKPHLRWGMKSIMPLQCLCRWRLRCTRFDSSDKSLYDFHLSIVSFYVGLVLLHYTSCHMFIVKTSAISSGAKMAVIKAYTQISVPIVISFNLLIVMFFSVSMLFKRTQNKSSDA